MNQIIINGKVIQTTGNNISVIGDTIYVDGEKMESGLSGIVELKFIGDLANLNTKGSATVNGDVKGDVDAGGSITISGSVGGDVDAGGSIRCGNVEGNVDAGGSIRMTKY